MAPEIRAALSRLDLETSPRSGSLYEVSIDAEPEDLLDWDKPLSEQSPEVKAALGWGNADEVKAYHDALRKHNSSLEKLDDIEDPFSSSYTHDEAFFRLAESIRGNRPHLERNGAAIVRDMAQDPAEVSRRLREAGIPGIRYLDQGSRGSGAGTANFVIFDDTLVKITKRNGEPVSGEERQDVIDQMHDEQEAGAGQDQMLALRRDAGSVSPGGDAMRQVVERDLAEVFDEFNVRSIEELRQRAAELPKDIKEINRLSDEIDRLDMLDIDRHYGAGYEGYLGEYPSSPESLTAQAAYSAILAKYGPDTDFGYVTDVLPHELKSKLKRAEKLAERLARTSSPGKPSGGSLSLGDELLALRAFHGSPHDFDRFSMDKIGTGEGAQVFGHGLYMAENELTAQTYRDNLSDITIDGEVAWNPQDHYLAQSKMAGELDAIERTARDNLARAKAVPATTEAEARGLFSTVEKLDARRQQNIDEAQAYLDRIEQIQKAEVKSAGNLYEVKVDVEPEQLLDWDKPLSQQSEKVQAAFGKAGIVNIGPIPDRIEQLPTGRWVVKSGDEIVGRADGWPEKTIAETVLSENAKYREKLGGRTVGDILSDRTIPGNLEGKSQALSEAGIGAYSGCEGSKAGRGLSSSATRGSGIPVASISRSLNAVPTLKLAKSHVRKWIRFLCSKLAVE
jgi:hypothetical protein